jgi:hypothetical protein
MTSAMHSDDVQQQAMFSYFSLEVRYRGTERAKNLIKDFLKYDKKIKQSFRPEIWTLVHSLCYRTIRERFAAQPDKGQS